jgi:hypothetical protein
VVHGDQDPLWDNLLSQEAHMNHPTILKIFEQILDLLVGLSTVYSFSKHNQLTFCLMLLRHNVRMLLTIKFNFEMRCGSANISGGILNKSGFSLIMACDS